MRAYIAVFLLTAGLVAPALAETAPQLVNVQQPDGERAAQLKRQKAYRRAAATRAAQAKQTRATRAAPPRVAQSSGPTRIVPGNQVAPAASSSSSWSSSMLSWWRGESSPPSAGQGTAAQVSAEPAAARVETAATTEPAKTTRRKVRRTRRSESTATGAVPETSQAEAKVEKPTRSKRRSAKRSRSRDRQVAARPSAARQADRSRDNAPPEPRPKPVNSARQETAPPAAEADSTVGSISPAEVKERGGSRMAALSSEHAADGGEATWWQRQGNPVVFNFRDCVASYASREAQRNKDGTWADLLIRATEGDCRAPFDEMARTLATRFGEGRIEPVMRELIDTTFLPAAKQAAAEGAPASAAPSSDIPPLPPIPENVPTQ